MKSIHYSLRSILLGLLMALAPWGAFADTPGFAETQALFEQGLRGDADAAEQSYPGLQKLVREHPDNPLFLAYLGANETLFARDRWMPWTRIKFLDSGLDKVDKALAMLGPEHDGQTERGSIVSLETRLVALSTYVAVPSFSNRLQDARDLLADTLEQPAFGKAPPEVRQRIYLQGANIARRDEDKAQELKYLKLALDARPGQSHYAEIVRKRLNELQ